MELRLGKMTGHELAEWFGISYKTYSDRRKKWLSKLDDFCTFTEFRGGVEIESIFIPKYDKAIDISRDMTYLAEEKASIDGLMTGAGIARKTTGTKDKKEIARISKQYLKSRDKLFGKPGKRFEDNVGLCGTCKRTWAIKIDDYNHQRKLTPEEEQILYKYSLSYNLDDMAEELYFTSEDNVEISLEEYKKQKRNWFKNNVLDPFLEETGCQLLIATEHIVNWDLSENCEQKEYQQILKNYYENLI